MLKIAQQIRADFSQLDGRAVFALTYTAAALTGISYLKDTKYLAALLANTSYSEIGIEAANPTADNLYGLTWWVAVSICFYFVIPALVVVLFQKRQLREVGLALRVEPGFLRLLAACIIVMLPLVYLMSLTDGFSEKYPFLVVRGDLPYYGQTLLIWELIYFLQFFGLEFFFRGFLVHSLKPALGLYSVLIMTVPYTMIHFQKPMPEAFAAIIAGLFLGWISYRNGTIWLGLVLHCTVAFAMDILALWNKGLIF
ncbi:MAG: CPBP family intramembrane glutamic endopeptidase [Pyrinomonadaceae bacterium]